MPGFHVRAATPADRAGVARMRHALWPDSTEPEVDEVLSWSPAYGVILVAEAAAGDPVGYAEVRLRDYAEGCVSAPVGYLEGIWVDPSARRAGVAAALVDAGTAWAGERGCTEFASDCALDNGASESWHRAIGFEEVDRAIHFKREIGEAHQ